MEPEDFGLGGENFEELKKHLENAELKMGLEAIRDMYLAFKGVGLPVTDAAALTVALMQGFGNADD